MAFPATSTLFALFVTFCTVGRGLTAEKSTRPHGVRQQAATTASAVAQRGTWELPVQLDGRPVERYSFGSTKPLRPHRFGKAGKDKHGHAPPLEDVDPEWVNLDGFAVLGGAPVNISSAGSAVSSVTPAKPEPPVQAPVAAVDRTPQTSGGSPHARVHRRPPQSSSGPRQLERRALVRRTPLLERRRQHSTKPQSDQRNRNAHKLASESVHVVSLQAQRAQGRSAPVSRTVMTKITPPEPEEYEAKDITVRVMSAQSVLISWVDPAVEMEKVTPVTGGVRYYTVKYREKGESARWEYKESTQRRMLIDTLSADGMYEFSVRITQGENHGKWSVSVFQRTPESAPSGPPEDFEVKPLRGKGTAVIATWEPPEEPNGRIREYILSYAPAMKPFGMKSVTHRGSTTKATIEGLTPGDRYIFKIRATNRRGQGPQSKAFSVVMPGTSGGASSSSKSHASHTPSHIPTKQDSYLDDIDRQSAEVTEEPTTAPPTAQAPSTNRRTRPLSQTRSYHSIFSAVRGSVRNGGSGRGRSRKEEEGKTPTTPPPEEEAVIEEIVEEKKEPDNNVFYPESVDTKGHGEEHQTPTPETPSPKTETPTIAPTKPVPNPPKPPPRRPIKIRVHQKPGSKASSSSSSPASSSTQSSSSLPHTSESQESAVGKKDYTASLMPESKDTYVQSKPSTPAPKQTSSQSSTVAPLVGRGSATGGRISGSVIGSRYGFGRRNHGFLSRWNLTRTALGVKHGSTSNLPSRTQNQGTSNTQSSTSQSAMPTGSQNREKLSTFSSAVSRSDARTGTQSESISKTDTSAASQSSRSQNPTSSHTNSPASSETHNSGIPQSTSDRGSHNPATSRNTHNPQSSHTQTKQDTIYREDADDGKHKNTESEASKADEETSSSHLATLNTNTQTTEEKKDGEEREESSDEKPSHPPVRLHPSFAERFPSLASRYPGKFGSGARLPSTRQESRIPWSRSSSSIGAGRPISRGTPTRVSGANGAAGVSTIQETGEDPNTASTRKPLKSGEGASSLKPSLTIRKNDFSESRQSSTSSSSHSNPHHSSGGQGLPVHRGSSKNNYNDHEEEYLYEGSRETDERTEKVPDPTAAPKTPTLTSVDQHKSLDSPTGGRTGSAASPSLRRPVVGANGRVRGRLPFRVQPAQNTRLSLSNTDSSASSSSASSASSNLPKPVLTSDRGVSSGTGVSRTGGLYGENSRSASSSNSQGTRTRYPNFRGKPTNGGAVKPGYGNDKNGRPNLTTANDKEPSSSVDESKPRQHFITGPDGTKWIVDLVQGVLMNEEGQVLQDSQGRPNKVVLGDDGRTIFDHQGSPLVNEEGLALFGHGRDSRPVINPKDKVLTVGGKPVLGLNRPHHRTTTATTTTTTTMAPTTTTEEPTTLPPTTEQHIEETTQPYPTCPPGTFTKTDEYGYPVLDPEGILDCYPEDDFFAQTTLPPSTTTTTTTTTSVATTTSTTTTTVAHTPEPDSKHNNSPLSEFDLTGKKRFTAPYVNYIQKDPGAPCSLTEALEYLQVDVLQELMEKDRQSANQNQPPKNKPHNITVVAMEGCHSFVILDWAIPLQDDMVSGYMVHSASYDDILNNRWSTQASSGTHLAVENLKPNSRYYFKVQAKNVFGLGPVSDTLTYVTESDDPLLIERPPGGEPIWIPFTFKYNHAHSTCKGSQYVKRTWYRKFVGVVLCNSLRYKIFMGDGLREPFYSIADTFGQGEDHCQFVDSYLDGRTGPVYLSNNVPAAQGFYRAYRQEPVTFGTIGRRTAHPFVGWYECGVPIPGKW